MVRTKTVADGVNIGIKCPKCGEKTEKTEKVLSWLVNENIVPCPRCGHGINLKDGDNGRRIKEVASEAARFQAALTKAGDSR